MSVILVTHDLGVVAETCDRVAVMYAGRIMETGPTRAVFRAPAHAYTLGSDALRAARPRRRGRGCRRSPARRPSRARCRPACRFAPRCGMAISACGEAPPPLRQVGAFHASACLRADLSRGMSTPHLLAVDDLVRTLPAAARILRGC